MEATQKQVFSRALLSLAIPIALQNLVVFSAGFIDGVLAGRLGDAAISGVYMGNQPWQLLALLTGGIDGTVLLLCSQYKGKGDKESIRKIASLGLKISLLLGILTTIVCLCAPRAVLSVLTNKREFIDTGTTYLRIACLSYPFFCITVSAVASLRSVGRARVGLYLSGVFLLSKLVLSFALARGRFGFPALGIRGLAIATVVARILEGSLALLYLLAIERELALRPRHLLSYDRKMLSDMIKYGSRIMLGQVIWAVNIFSASAIMGRQTAEGAVAAMSVANSLQALGYASVNGVSSALGVITAGTVGSGNTELMKAYARRAERLLLILAPVSGVILFALRSLFISLYAGLSPAAVAQAGKLTAVVAITMACASYQIPCLFGLVKGGGDVGFVLRCDIWVVLAVVLPAGVISSAIGAPPWVVLLCLRSDQIIKCFIAAFKVRRFDWMKNLTRAAK